MKQQLTIGIIGAGRIGKLHVENIIHHIPNANVKAIADIKIDHLKEWAEELHILHITTDYTDILNDTEIQAVLICSSTDTHAKFIIESAKAGKHIFCEKPIDHDVGRIYQALDVVKNAGVKLMIGFNRRFDHDFKRIQKSIQANDIGEPHIIKITSRDPNPPPIEYIKVSGGLFFDMAIHDWDMSRFLSGEEIEEIFASGAIRIDPEIGKVGDIDTSMAILTTTSGTMICVDNSRKAIYGYDQRVEVFGSKGLAMNFNETINNVEIYNNNSIMRDKMPNFFLERYKNSYIAELQEFIDCIQNDVAPSVDGNDGLQAVLIAKAAQISMKEHRPVKLLEVSGSLNKG